MVRLAAGAPREQRDTALRCAVGGDFRDSLLVHPGTVWAAEARVPAGGVLRYAVVQAPDERPTPAWHLTVEDAVDDVALAEDTAAPTRAWSRRALELAPWSGRTVRVRARVGRREEASGRPGSVCLANPIVVPAGHSGPLVLVVLLDTVRADHLGLLGYGRPTTPALEALAADGVTFEDAASDASWTRASVATLFTGLPVSTHGVLARGASLRRRWTTMAERFRAAGFDTVALTTNVNVSRRWGMARGFDRMVEVDAAEGVNTDARTVLGVAADVIADAGTDPLLLYVHVNDAHAPYDPPAAAARALHGRYDPDGPGRTLEKDPPAHELAGAVDRYDAEIAYVDGLLGALFADLAGRGRYQPALIVVLADHGEEFGDHGGLAHGHTLFREQLHVPLVMKLPGDAGAGTRVAAPVSVVDVLPTMLAVLGLPVAGLPGRVLLDPGGTPRAGSSLPRTAITDLGWATVYAAEDEAFSLIVETRPAFRRRLYDRRADPRQRHDVAARHPAALARLGSVIARELLARRPGWHLRLCGGAAPRVASVRLQGRTPLARIERLDGEAGDRLDTAEAGTVVTWTADLTPPDPAPGATPPSADGPPPAPAVDHDALIFTNAGPIAVAVDVPVRLGADARPHDGRSITVADATVTTFYWPTCPGEPALLVWHVPAVAPRAAIDAATERRLRALGYLP